MAPPHQFSAKSRNPRSRIPQEISPQTEDFRATRKSGDSRAEPPSGSDPPRSTPMARFRARFSPESESKTRDAGLETGPTRIQWRPPINFRRNPGIRVPGFPMKSHQKPKISAHPRNRAICGRGSPQVPTPLGRRRWPVFGPVFRRNPHLKRATQASKRALPEFNAAPSSISTKSRNLRSRISHEIPTETEEFRATPKSGDLWAGQPSISDPHGPAPMANFRARFLLESAPKTRGGGVETGSAGIQCPPLINFRRNPGIRVPGFPKKSR